MAKTRAYGADAQLIAAIESTYGTAPDGSGEGVYSKLPMSSIDLGLERPLGTDPLLGKGRDAQDAFYEGINVAGNVEVPLDLRDIGFWLQLLFGDPVTTGTDPYTHVFTSGGQLPSATLEIGHTALTTPIYLQNTGVKAGGLTFDMARTGPAKATIPLIAQGEASSSTVEDAAPLSRALSRFNNGSGTIKVGGSQLAAVTGGRLDFSNNLEAVETIRADGKIDGADETEATCNGSMNIRYSTDTTLSAAAAAETPVVLQYEFTIPSTSYKLTFDMPRVFLPRVKNAISGPGGLAANFDFQAAFDETAGHMLQVTLINDMATY